MGSCPDGKDVDHSLWGSSVWKVTLGTFSFDTPCTYSPGPLSLNLCWPLFSAVIVASILIPLSVWAPHTILGCNTRPVGSYFPHEALNLCFLPWECGTLTTGGAALVAKSCPTLETLWTVARQAPLSMGFPRQERWSGLPFPSAGDLLDPRIEPRSPALQADSLSAEPQGEPYSWMTRQLPSLLDSSEF